MNAIEQLSLVSVEEYLAAERDSEIRHEYVGGYVHAMAGGKNVHNRVAANFLISVGGQLRGKPCEPFNSDVKVRIQASGYTSFYYPDGMVVCEPNGPADTFQDRPVVVAEVLSDSTRRVDQLEKRDAYLAIPSLAVYLLIETDKPEVVAYRRSESGFQSELYRGQEAVIPLAEVDAELPLAELYERVKFAQADA
ncbi:MAG: Uma2 family endonuclease [Planctomycetota bacterium]